MAGNKKNYNHIGSPDDYPDVKNINSLEWVELFRSMKRTTTFYKLIYHFISGTKNHLPLLTPSIETRLFPYIGYKCKELGYFLHAINGTEDHIHLLLSLTPSILVADVAKNLKGASSHYINKETNLGEVLYWQDGYGVVTLREAEIPKVIRYINRQKEHHLGGDLSGVLERIEK